MPRVYRLGERAAQMQATRERIVEAAIALYTEKGIGATTLREIGLRADVAPGTLRNHFSSREALERAVVDRLTDKAPLPDRSIFDGAPSIGERLRRLIQATGRFLDQAQPIYRMWLREPMVSGPWAEKGAEYGARWHELMRIALGPVAADEESMAILRGVMHPTFFDSVRGGTRTTDEASELITAALVPWFAARERATAQVDR
ncbi:MAG TPA: TetR/AcrR family transcriptional regulator [Candidatus Limnocylindria bacterium]